MEHMEGSVERMQNIFFWTPLKLFYQAAKWDIGAFHGSEVLRSQKMTCPGVR